MRARRENSAVLLHLHTLINVENRLCYMTFQLTDPATVRGNLIVYRLSREKLSVPFVCTFGFSPVFGFLPFGGWSFTELLLSLCFCLLALDGSSSLWHCRSTSRVSLAGLGSEQRSFLPSLSFSDYFSATAAAAFALALASTVFAFLFSFTDTLPMLPYNE